MFSRPTQCYVDTKFHDEFIFNGFEAFKECCDAAIALQIIVKLTTK